MGIERFVGVDLAWAEDRGAAATNESGVAVIDGSGEVLDAGWTRGLDQTLAWIEAAVAGGEALTFVDAPLVVDNPRGQRRCETQVGQCYGRWHVSANTTNLGSPRQAGVGLLRLLMARGWAYHDGFDGPPTGGRVVSECYPYTTLVGVVELGYHHDGQRPRYKRRPKRLPVAQWRPIRASNCDDLIRRLAALDGADPPLRLRSHPRTEELASQASPSDDRTYKHREDLIDAVVCAWTAALWHRHGLARCQVLGQPQPAGEPAATIIAPAAVDQRWNRSP